MTVGHRVSLDDALRPQQTSFPPGLSSRSQRMLLEGQVFGPRTACTVTSSRSW